MRNAMPEDLETNATVPSPNTDPFIAKLRAMRESLRAEAYEARYRLKELEYRLIDRGLDDLS
jgi:hypothetical protein